MPKDPQYIKLLLVFDIKHDGRKCARLVAGVDMTNKWDTEQSKSFMVTLDFIRLGFLAMKMVGLDCLTGDITSAYIYAYIREKVYKL